MKLFQRIAAAAVLVATLAAGSAWAQTSPVAPIAAMNTASADGRTADTWLRNGDSFFVQYSVYTKHFSQNPEHVNHNQLINVEVQSNYDRVWGADKTLFGLAFFKNSFGQPSQWLYWGQKWDVTPYFYAKLSAGLLHGYKGKYRDKIPFNKAGVAPGIIPSIGFQYKGFTIQTNFLGTSAVLVAVGYEF